MSLHPTKHALRHMCACAGMGGVGAQRALEATFGVLVVVTDTCGFIEEEVKAEGGSCSCMAGLIYAYNEREREEVKSRNWQRATVI